MAIGTIAGIGIFKFDIRYKAWTYDNYQSWIPATLVTPAILQQSLPIQAAQGRRKSGRYWIGSGLRAGGRCCRLSACRTPF